jgi:hypothetical protein
MWDKKRGQATFYFFIQVQRLLEKLPVPFSCPKLKFDGHT